MLKEFSTQSATVTLTVFLSFLETTALAESVNVKYHGSVPLDTFQCTDVQRSSLVKRVCYDRINQYLIISLKGVYYHYCEIDRATVEGLLSAESMGRFFSMYIRGNGNDGPFDCRTHKVPVF